MEVLLLYLLHTIVLVLEDSSGHVAHTSRKICHFEEKQSYFLLFSIFVNALNSAYNKEFALRADLFLSYPLIQVLWYVPSIIIIPPLPPALPLLVFNIILFCLIKLHRQCQSMVKAVLSSPRLTPRFPIKLELRI